ncbi:hypothetical protein HNQ59_001183 [Chitinivorax tropicus]|uniref:DUF2062 domain-containing protein n=1 Tax=Chitinivorax tropicus TaxID=714531 RepID=A0A840MP05_9PROT|nr:DUF2062 domain-containing protein [Chitinivorax tropicus]MBB5017913.1 hypothetical protein [Chitinivorax tropicus]
MKKWLHRRLPTPEKIMAQQWLGPARPYLARPELWYINRKGMALGLAVGLFIGFAIPIAQIALASLAAIWFRHNLPVAAAATLITNPFTVPPIYFSAYQLGGWMLPDLKMYEHWLANLGAPFVVGLLTIAIVSSLLGYFGLHAAWKGSVVLRWRARQRNKQASCETM